MDGAQVWPAYREGRIDEIRAYCETDVANTWLMYCRFQLLRGAWDASRYAQEIALARETLSRAEGAHWREFLAAWPE
jgi:predicted PolB exonuclease-like 3'-5' exonuclease